MIDSDWNLIWQFSRFIAWACTNTQRQMFNGPPSFYLRKARTLNYNGHGSFKNRQSTIRVQSQRQRQGCLKNRLTSGRMRTAKYVLCWTTSKWPKSFVRLVCKSKNNDETILRSAETRVSKLPVPQNALLIYSKAYSMILFQATHSSTHFRTPWQQL